MVDSYFLYSSKSDMDVRQSYKGVKSSLCMDHPESIVIKKIRADPLVNIACDTLLRDKQLLCFVGSKRAAEKVASDVARVIPKAGCSVSEHCAGLSKLILKAVSTPTEQCIRLSKCISNGVAFHHAGIASGQREIIEQGFAQGYIRMIASTPTLAAGLDLPAFRVVIRDLKRYSGSWGMQNIPVLEYLQMAGRAGRPGKEEYGEAITLAGNPVQKQDIIDTFIHGSVEPIYSKLAVEPVLRTYVLALCAGGFITDIQQAHRFFSKTLWAHQYGDMHKLYSIIERVVGLLRSYGFLESVEDESGYGEFRSGKALVATETLRATSLGVRVAELYLDPLTAHHLCVGLRSRQTGQPMSYLHMVCESLEMRPLLRVKQREIEGIEDQLAVYRDDFFTQQPTWFDEGFQEYLEAFKTALSLRDWIDEAGEDVLLDRYDIRPGELRGKLDVADWLVMCCIDLAQHINVRHHIGNLVRLRTRLVHGVREDLLPLLRFKHIGRKRARILFSAGIKHSGDVRGCSIERLSSLIGSSIAADIKKQAGSDSVSFEPISSFSE